METKRTVIKCYDPRHEKPCDVQPDECTACMDECSPDYWSDVPLTAQDIRNIGEAK